MKRTCSDRTGVTLLRPWPFGPPLRGRAPHRDAGTQGAPRDRASRTAMRALSPGKGWATPLPNVSVL